MIVVWAGLFCAGLLYLVAPYFLLFAGIMLGVASEKNPHLDLGLIALVVGLVGAIWTVIRHRNSSPAPARPAPALPTTAKDIEDGRRALLIARATLVFFFLVGAIDELARRGFTGTTAQMIFLIGSVCVLFYGVLYSALWRAGRLPVKGSKEGSETAS